MPSANLRCRKIPLRKIRFNQEWSLHPWESAVICDSLLQSFHRTGIIHKPILLDRSTGCFDILCGYKRLQFALLTKHMISVECLVFARDTDVTLLFDTLLTEQSLTQPLSLAEKARFVELCSRFLDHEDIVARYFERLHLRKLPSTITELSNILQQDPLFISEIHAGRLQEKIVSELLKLPEISDRIAVVQLFKDLAMGDSKQKRFFALLRDLSCRHNSSLSEYLKSPAICAILKHPVLNTPQKVQHLGTYLQQQVNPMSSKAEEDFIKQVRDLHLPSRCSITHSPSFEKDDITLSITFSHFSDCAKIAPDINILLRKHNYLE
jgi:hypothetical protein